MLFVIFLSEVHFSVDFNCFSRPYFLLSVSLTVVALLALCCRNVEELIRFPDVKSQRQLTYGAKQLIAREVNSLLLRYI